MFLTVLFFISFISVFVYGNILFTRQAVVIKHGKYSDTKITSIRKQYSYWDE